MCGLVLWVVTQLNCKNLVFDLDTPIEQNRIQSWGNCMHPYPLCLCTLVNTSSYKIVSFSPDLWAILAIWVCVWTAVHAVHECLFCWSNLGAEQSVTVILLNPVFVPELFSVLGEPLNCQCSFSHLPLLSPATLLHLSIVGCVLCVCVITYLILFLPLLSSSFFSTISFCNCIILF